MRNDLYPSRHNTGSGILERQDPVVWNDNIDQCPISKIQLDYYKSNGFLILKNFLSHDEVNQLQQELESMKNNPVGIPSDYIIHEPNSGEVRSIFKVHSTNPLFEKLCKDPNILKIVQYILNDSVYIHQSRLNYKPGFHGKEFYWHSDFETWHVEDGMPNMRALSISIPLTENFEHNGSLMLIPGSHKKFISCEGETPENHFKASLKKQEYGVPDDRSLSELVDEGGIATAIATPGSIILFDCNTMHGSNGNITPFPRSNLFFVYNAVSNKVQAPFCNRPPRPEYICTRAKPEIEELQTF